MFRDTLYDMANIPDIETKNHWANTDIDTTLTPIL